MVDLEALSRRARASEDGEAYVAIAKTLGYRLGVGARIVSESEPEYFVEVVLDPFPNRPSVEPETLAAQGALAARLRRRGYSLTCDDAGAITCERTMSRAAVPKELREAPRLIGKRSCGKARTRRPGSPDEAS